MYRDARDLESGNTGRRRNLERLLQVLEKPRDLLQQEGFPDAGCASEEDGATVSDLVQYRLLLIGTPRVGFPDFRFLFFDADFLLDLEASTTSAVARDARRRDGEAKLRQALLGELFPFLLPVVCVLVLFSLPSLLISASVVLVLARDRQRERA